MTSLAADAAAASQMLVVSPHQLRKRTATSISRSNSGLTSTHPGVGPCGPAAHRHRLIRLSGSLDVRCCIIRCVCVRHSDGMMCTKVLYACLGWSACMHCKPCRQCKQSTNNVHSFIQHGTLPLYLYYRTTGDTFWLSGWY